MSWPLSQDYNEAIQDPRGNFRDAELKAGEAVTNALGIPMPRSGNFADVYEVRCRSGARWAVKCFTREVHGLRERYAEISNYLRQANLPFMVNFQYLQEGIRVRSQWYPILKMQWVEGFVLNEFVRDNLDKKPILLALGQIWLRMARRLRQAKLAHGDLQHGNVLFVPGSSARSLAVKLIDYDGMCVPTLAGRSSGEVGHPAYQHPERLRTGAYNQEIDRFSLLSIAAALRCLTIGGRSLWERYDTGDNLLFRQTDLQAPAESPLFGELLAIEDPQAQLLVTELYRACQGPLEAVPLLIDLLPEEKPPSKVITDEERQAAADEGTEWDFGDGEPATPYIRKRRTSSGLPLWLWGVLGGAAAILVSVVVGADLFLNNSRTNIKGTPAVPTSSPEKKSSAAKSRTQPSGNPGAWEKVDPEGDCEFQNVGGKLTITVPAKAHALEVWNGRTNAPRLLLDVEGDFVVQVRVGGDFEPAAASTGGRLSWIGAGLLLWGDENTFFRLERAGWHGRQPPLYANWEARQDGEQKTLDHSFLGLSGPATYLRLQRRGNELRAFYGGDGQRWTPVEPVSIELPTKIKIGVIAGSTTARPFAPIFDQFKLKLGQGKVVRIDWPQLR
jgi:regulation of enolase protein 1 (concanavalin A-like superfamily)